MIPNFENAFIMFSNIKLVVLFSVIVFYSSTLFAQSEIKKEDNSTFVVKKNDNVLNYIRKNMAFSVIVFEKKMAFCEKQKSKESYILLDTNYLKSINATRNDVITGLIYWDYKNTFNCEADARLKFAYDVSTLASAQIRYNLDSSETLEIASGFAYPSVEILEHLSNYSKLPIKLREYLEKTIGNNLFNVLSSIEHIKLPR